MATDFNNSGKTITSSGGFQPSVKNTPLDSRTRINLKADIDSIPNPFVGMHIIVLQDETNNNKMTEYIVKSLTANSLGVADTKINEIVLVKDFLEVSNSSSGGGVDLSGYATETYVMDKLGGKSLVYLTQVEYDSLSEAEKQDDTKVYNIIDAVIDYNEIINTPTIPTKTSELTNDSNFTTKTYVDDQISNINAGNTGTYVLPIASNNTLGGVKIGSGLSIDSNGTLSATGIDGVNNVKRAMFSSDNPHASINLDIKTYTEGQNQPMHPKVLYFENGWNGFKYWMAYTPLPNEDNENPCIAVSNNMIDWTVPSGFENPLAWKPSSGGYNSDTHLVYVSKTNTLECWYREIIQSVSQETFYRRTTTDGINWTEAEQTFQSTGSITANLSPCLLFEDNKYKMWTFANSPTFKYYESEDGLNWTKIKDITVEGGNWWHGDVIHTAKGYEFLLYINSGGKLYYTHSTDNATFKSPILILEPTGVSGNWDSNNLYRSSFFIKNDYYYIFYSGNSGTEWHIGLTRGKSIADLRGFVGSRTLTLIEAIEELYDMLDGGTNNNGTVTVEPTNISLNVSSLEINSGDTYILQATILPTNATNKTLTWESDNNEIATVNNGIVTGVSNGTCTITVKTANNLSATCNVTVSETAVAPTDGIIQDGLVCWLDAKDNSGNSEVWNDKTSNGNNVTLSNFSYDSSVSGWTGTSLLFDGIDDYCSLTGSSFNGLSSSSSEMTVCVNVKFNKIGKDQVITEVASGNRGRFLVLADNNISYQYKGNLLKTNVTAEVGKTYDLVFTFKYDPSNVELPSYRNVYVDGVNKYTMSENNSGNMNITGGTTPTIHLGSELGTSSFASININSVKIYSRELTEDEILKNYEYEQSIIR